VLRRDGLLLGSVRARLWDEPRWGKSCIQIVTARVTRESIDRITWPRKRIELEEPQTRSLDVLQLDLQFTALPNSVQ
jgi:hypothetical protein